jgi:acetyl esterase/lipase
LYAGDLDVRDPIVSPLFGSFEGLPPIAVFTGTRDLTNPDASRLPATVYEYPGMVHVWMLFPMPEATRAVAQIASFVDGSAGEGAEAVAARRVA